MAYKTAIFLTVTDNEETSDHRDDGGNNDQRTDGDSEVATSGQSKRTPGHSLGRDAA